MQAGKGLQERGSASPRGALENGRIDCNAREGHGRAKHRQGHMLKNETLPGIVKRCAHCLEVKFPGHLFDIRAELTARLMTPTVEFVQHIVRFQGTAQAQTQSTSPA